MLSSFTSMMCSFLIGTSYKGKQNSKPHPQNIESVNFKPTAEALRFVSFLTVFHFLFTLFNFFYSVSLSYCWPVRSPL